MWFQTWHEEFGEFSPNHSQVQKFHFDGLFLSKVYDVWAKKIQRSYLSWHGTVMQIWINHHVVVSKIAWGIWLTFIRTPKSLKNCRMMDFLFKACNVLQLWNFRGILCHNTEGVAKFKGKLTCGSKNDMARIWLIFMQAVNSLKICNLIRSFYPKHRKI